MQAGTTDATDDEQIVIEYVSAPIDFGDLAVEPKEEEEQHMGLGLGFGGLGFAPKVRAPWV